MKRVGLFGGTFNPIHIGHVRLAEQFLERLLLDEVWLLVTPQNPWKQAQQLADDMLRLRIVSQAIADNRRLVASDYEFHLPRPSYTYQTLRHLREDFPDVEFTLLIGADNWAKFSNWAEPEEIMAHHRIAVYPRQGYSVDESALPANVTVVDTLLYNISSTEIRRRLQHGQPIAGLVPRAVEAMIVREYQSGQKKE